MSSSLKLSSGILKSSRDLSTNFISNANGENGTSGYTTYNDTQTVTITIATPAVFTVTSTTGFYIGMPITFSTTGALPTGLTAGTTYYVSAVPSSSTFRVSASLGGSDVNTSGTQSGTHTARPQVPVTATGSSPNVTISTTTSTPIAGAQSITFSKDANNRMGEGFRYDFTIDNGSQAKVLNVTCQYLVSSGTFTAGVNGSSPVESDVEIYLYDVTNSLLIQPSSFRLLSNSSTIADTFRASFQTAYNSTSYRLIFHVSTTSSSSYTLKLGNITINPTTYVYGTPITDWQTYTLNIGGTTTAPTLGSGAVSTAKYRRVGDTEEIMFQLTQLAAGTAGSGRYLFPIAPNTTIDTTKALVTTGVIGAGANCLGTGFTSTTAAQNTGSADPCWVHAYDTQNLQLISLNATSAHEFQPISSTNYPLSGSTIYYTFFAAVPITGWSSSVQMSDSSDTRVVAVRADNTAGTTIPNSESDFLPATTTYDTHGAYSNSTGFVCPTPGYYEGYMQYITSSFSTLSSVVGRIWKNGNKQSSSVTINSGISGQYTVISKATMLCNAGDIIKGRYFVSSGTPTLDTAAGSCFFEVKKVLGPNAIAANESIYFRTGAVTPTGTIGSTFAGSTTAIFSSALFDSHGAYSTSTGKYTVQSPGRYLINAHVRANGSLTAGGSFITVAFGKNGSEYADGILSYSTATASTSIDSAGTCLMNCNAGDTIEIRAISNAATTWTADTNRNYLEIIRMP